MKSKRLCFGLSTEHTARNCPKRKTCAIVNCTRKHPTVLHTNSVARRPEANNATTSSSSREEVLHVQSAMVNADGKISALVGTDASKTAMAVVPVKVWPKGNGTPVITYAFLDNGSSSSFCTEALMRQLGVNGPRTLISLTTLDRKNSLTDSFVLQDLAISDLDENVFVKLPTLYTRALGVRWCIETDTLGLKIDLKHSPPTRTGILSVVSSVYDPLGLAAPFVLPAKRLLQDLCREKLGWDDAIPSNYEVSWERWLADLPKLSKFSVERCLKPDGFGVIRSSQLHHFADASEIGYGSVGYLRLVNGRNEAHCSFLCAKSRVAPLKMITIPRLELSAAVTAVKQDRLLKRELEISVNARSVFWTDSTAVLRYVKNETNRYHTFVANRVAIIRDGSQPNQWFHVNGDNNPADDASRGLTADIFLRQSRWLTGPAFLWKHDSMWPTQDELFGEIANDDPEVKREVRATMSSLGTPGSPLLHYASRCSSWSLLVKVVAWLFRYKNNLLKASKGDKPRNDSLVLITLDEIQRAEGEILKHVQQQSFPEETANPKKQAKKSSRLYKLDPIFVDGLLCVGGRLRNSTLSPESKNQIILPRDDHVSRLIIYHYHKACGHSGREHVLSRIRETFWITQGSSAVKSVLAKCVICRRSQASLCQQKMADWPEDRVQPDRPPFTSVGLDFFGPFQVRRGRSLVKRYGVIFTCLAIRAVHIEVAFSLDTDSFLLALRRFIARRGQVKEIYSDNGTNFTSGERELRDAISEWNQERRIHNSLLQKDIKWTFSPPYGSHLGGIWERCIRTIRKILRSLLREQITDDESLPTLMCEVESILNSRPISTVSSDPYDLEPLTPNHLLLLKSEVPLPPGLFQHKDLL